jgi:cytochrome c-type biogenesis protein CcmH
MVALFWIVTALLAMAVGLWLAAPLKDAPQKRAALTIVGFIPLFALAVYLLIGAPDEPDQPLAPRMQGKLEDLPPAAILARLEMQLRETPNDPQGWRLMARLRMTVGDYPKAGDAWQRLLDLQPQDGEARLGLAQALIEQDGGVVPPVAVQLLDEALALMPDNASALFWRAEAHHQLGEKSQAKTLWRILRAKMPDGTPLARALDKRLAD